MWGIIAFFALLAIAVAVLKGLAEKASNAPSAEPLPFEKAPPLFSPAERSFYGVLEQALGDDYRIFAKVRLGDVIQPKRGVEKSTYYTARNMIDRKHLDYVVCGKSDFVALGAIELDDKSHERQDRQGRDAFVDRALEDAGIPIIHFSARAVYPVQDVRLNIANAFSLSLKGVKPPAQATDNYEKISRQETNGVEFRFGYGEDSGGTSSSPVADKKVPPEACPDCGAKMIVKKVSRGPHSGRAFWVCIKYPQCRSIMPIDKDVAAQMDF